MSNALLHILAKFQNKTLTLRRYETMTVEMKWSLCASETGKKVDGLTPTINITFNLQMIYSASSMWILLFLQ